MKISDYFDRKFIEEFTIKPSVKAMSKAERLRLLGDMLPTAKAGGFLVHGPLPIK